MAASQSNQIPDNSTDANFRAWITAIINALTAGGIVRTTDTGQINEATVVKPAAANTFQGYAMFRSNDATGGLHNWYMRLDFGSGVANQNIPAIKFTFGWGTDGAGTINSTNKLTQYQVTGGNNVAGQVSTFSSGTGWFCITIFDASSLGIGMSVERTRDKNGAEQDEIFYWTHSNNGGQSGVLPYTGTIPTQSTAVGDGWLGISSSLAALSGNFGIGTCRPIKGGFCMDSMNMFLGNTTHFTAGLSLLTMTVYGATHTYILRNTALAPVPIAGHRMICRYE